MSTFDEGYEIAFGLGFGQQRLKGVDQRVFLAKMLENYASAGAEPPTLEFLAAVAEEQARFSKTRKKE